jgi:hypothetical protein
MKAHNLAALQIVIFSTLLILVAILAIGFMQQRGEECRQRGGVPVRGIWWVECVEGRR